MKKSTKTCLLIILLLVVSLGVYYRAYNIYFTADSIWQVHYYDRVLKGDWYLLWRNFSGNYVEIPGAQFLRPLLGITFFIDYFFWRTNSFGWNLTTIGLHSINCILIFLFSNRLLRSFNINASNTVSFVAALLFAVCPLHCEATAWLAGRGDVLAGVFVLSALYLFLWWKNTDKFYLYVLAAFSFFLALLSKEASITYPGFVFALAYFVNPEFDENSKGKRLFVAFQESFIFFLMGLFYLGYRYLCFGSIMGGYQGGFGHDIGRHAYMRWLDPENWSRVFLPFNAEAITDLDLFTQLSCFAYAIIFISLLIKLAFNRPLPLRLFGFCFSWFLISLVPLVGFFQIDRYMHGSRVFFFASVPLYLLFSLFLFYMPEKNGNESSFRRALNLTQYIYGGIAATILVSVWAYATDKSNNNWYIAGETIKAVQQGALEINDKLKDNQQVIVTGMPADYFGSYVLLNSSTFHHLLRPPFTDKDISQKFKTFKTKIFSSSGQVSSYRFKRILNDKRTEGLYKFIDKKKKFQKLDMGSNDNEKAPVNLELDARSINFVGGYMEINDENKLVMEDVKEGTFIMFPGLSINPKNYDFLQMNVKAVQMNHFTHQLTPMMVTWNGKSYNQSMGAINSNVNYHINITLSQYPTWYIAERIKSIRVYPGSADKMIMSNFRLVNAESIVPVIDIVNAPALASGEHVILPKTEKLQVKFDATNIKGATNVLIEVTKPNFFFEGEMKKNQLAAANEFPAVVGQTRLPVDLFEEGAYQQIRMLALDDEGNPKGVYSEPATIFKNQGHPSSYLF